jgi:uncharacterized tellurite resistance protein B-like protein
VIGRLKALFDRTAVQHAKPSGREDFQIAAAALMVEAARLDSSFDDAERGRMRALLAARFGLSRAEAEDLVEEAAAAQASSADFFRFTHAVKEAFSHAERIEMIELLWEVAYADGVLHDHEASLLRRVAGLLYVDGRESGEARRRVLDRLGLAG